MKPSADVGFGRGSMPTYQCHFLDENERVVRIENLGSCGHDRDAHREARLLLAKVGHFFGYELWQDGRKIEVYTDPQNQGLHYRLLGHCHPICRGDRAG
jgi:hypothetical protein